jgi:hypothetical protein
VKKVLAVLFTAVLILSIIPAAALADNGAPNGYHFTLNIIGVKDKSADMDSEGGSTIFVKMDGVSKIFLQQYVPPEGSEMNFKDAFMVLDKNGTDADGASFMLPAPGFDAYLIGIDPSPDTIYSVYARPLGKPGGFATITTCAELINESTLFGMLPNSDQKEIKNIEKGLTAGGYMVYASVEQVGQAITERKPGQSKFENVTAELTSIVFEVDLIMVDPDTGEETVVATYFVRVPIFDAMLGEIYWEYDNTGDPDQDLTCLKHLQLRFYEVPTNLAVADGKFTPVPLPD